MIQDVVTVSQLSDLNQLLFQAHSIDLFVTNPITHWIIVQDQSDLEIWREKLTPFYHRHTLKLSPTLLPETHYHRPDRHGYRRQQLLKLMASQLISNERYMVLDSKNFFWRQQSLSNWPCLNGRPIITDVCATGPRQTWLDSVAKILGLNSTSHTYEVLTPFVMNTVIAQHCVSFDIDYLFNEVSKPFDYWESEFIFYSLIAHNFYNCITAAEITAKSDLSLADTYYITQADIEHNMLDKWYSVPTNLISAVHRDVVQSLSHDQRLTLIQWFVNKGFDVNIASQSLQSMAVQEPA